MLSWLQPYPALRKAVVNLKSGTVIRGVIWRRTGGYMVVRDAELLSDQGQAIQHRAVDGEILVELSHVDFVQVL